MYTVSDKTLDEIMRDLDSLKFPSERGADTYEVAQAAIAIKVAQANEKSAKTVASWARVSALASIASVLVAAAAVIVAVAS